MLHNVGDRLCSTTLIAMLGYIREQEAARAVALQTGGQHLFVSGNGSAQIQVVNLSGLP